ncbi:hypothetical protein Hypma_004275 [Hypsizygus marmoreus]|uniref:Uncharacterized protein n=1 Tax=Hypsizygus marmoreus TaxID=39966 RepID=A0A369J7L0_HYPMA|nr:hypothetical protein Hypma_004275 [Hypsizygus marmoreus]
MHTSLNLKDFQWPGSVAWSGELETALRQAEPIIEWRTFLILSPALRVRGPCRGSSRRYQSIDMGAFSTVDGFYVHLRHVLHSGYFGHLDTMHTNSKSMPTGTRSAAYTHLLVVVISGFSRDHGVQRMSTLPTYSHILTEYPILRTSIGIVPMREADQLSATCQQWSRAKQACHQDPDIYYSYSRARSCT